MLAEFLLALLAPNSAHPEAVEPEEVLTPWKGPGRVCGYATIIEMRRGETISLTGGGMHGNSFLWTLPSGTLSVMEVNWAVKPPNIERRLPSNGKVRLFRLGDDKGELRYALWDGGHLAAYVSGGALNGSKHDLPLLRRIALVDHAGERARGCKYTMTWGGFEEEALNRKGARISG